MKEMKKNMENNSVSIKEVEKKVNTKIDKVEKNLSERITNMETNLSTM